MNRVTTAHLSTGNPLERYDQALREHGWRAEGDEYTRDDGITKATILPCEGGCLLIIEVVDLFGPETGAWTPKTHPEREEFLRRLLAELAKVINANVNSIERGR